MKKILIAIFLLFQISYAEVTHNGEKFYMNIGYIASLNQTQTKGFDVDMGYMLYPYDKFSFGFGFEFLQSYGVVFDMLRLGYDFDAIHTNVYASIGTMYGNGYQINEDNLFTTINYGIEYNYDKSFVVGIKNTLINDNTHNNNLLIVYLGGKGFITH